MRAFQAPFWHALRDIASPPVVSSLTPSHIAALLGWDAMAAVRVVPLTDEEVNAAPQVMRRGTGKPSLRRVM